METCDIVLDCTFGDSGKGMMVDNICSQQEEFINSLVIRFSGGQQCGHTVMVLKPDGEECKHTFSSFGSGTMAGCPTFFTNHTTMYPVNLMNEYDILKEKGIDVKLFLDPLVKLTTPFDVFYNVAKENYIHHGSCGMGVGATMSRDKDSGYKLYAIDLLHPTVLKKKVESIMMNYYLPKANAEGFGDLFEGLMEENHHIVDKFFHCCEILRSFIIKDGDVSIAKFENIKNKFNHFVFEGSQGIMLDMDHGIFPHVTYANTTKRNAMEFIEKFSLPKPTVYYMTRAYETRHGAGWMPSSNVEVVLKNPETENNTYNEHQGHFRIGEKDVSLVNQAIYIDKLYGDAKESYLVVTCVDQYKFDPLDFRTTINLVDGFMTNNSPYRGNLSKL